jgi:catalase
MNTHINANKLNYYPNWRNVVHPIPTSEGGYVEWLTLFCTQTGIDHSIIASKKRFQVWSNAFAELSFKNTSIRLNYSLKPDEKAHLINAFSFEPDHCDDPDVYRTYTELLNDIDFNLARTVAENVGGVTPDKPARANHGK